MTAGYRAVQSTHAAINFIFEHYGRASPWFLESNTLVQLEVKNEKQLQLLIDKCQQLQICYTVFREPDIGNQITAVALEPSDKTQKLVRNIPLLFKDKIYNNVSSTQNPVDEGKGVQSDKNQALQETY